jgi:N-acetylneuraminic acid mutarotase
MDRFWRSWVRSKRKRQKEIFKITLFVFQFITLSTLFSGSKPRLVSANRADKSNPGYALQTRFTWTEKEALTYGRYGHTATLLSDGRVLVVGGVQGSEADRPGLINVEEYDPTTESWRLTGTLNIGRTDHRATLLPDGSVLVTGGKTGSSGPALNSVEIYDPVSRTWRIGPPLSVPRSGHSATLLGDGRVLVAGGRFSSDPEDVHASVEVYDPVSQSWTPTGELQTSREGHSATLLPDGLVLIVNGYDQTWLATNEVYDPSNGTWSYAVNPFGCHGVAHTATRMLDGRVLVVGGGCGSGTAGIRNEVDIFVPADLDWLSTTNLPQPREAHTATSLPDGRVLIVGGDNGDVPRYKSVLIYNPTNGDWYSAVPLATGRRGHTATRLKDNSVLVVGGWGDTNTSLASVELFQDATPTTTPTFTDTPLPPTSTMANSPLPPTWTVGPGTPLPPTLTVAAGTPTLMMTDTQIPPTQTELPVTSTDALTLTEELPAVTETLTDTTLTVTSEQLPATDLSTMTPTPLADGGSTNRNIYLVLMLISAVVCIILMVSFIIYVSRDT